MASIRVCNRQLLYTLFFLAELQIHFMTCVVKEQTRGKNYCRRLSPLLPAQSPQHAQR
jgi:hypothetical protein